MGHYTAFTLNVNVTPEFFKTYDTIDSFIESYDGIVYEEFKLQQKDLIKSLNLDHLEFFKTNQWLCLFQSQPIENVIKIDAKFKNYNNEIQKFLKWIHPHTLLGLKMVGTIKAEDWHYEQEIVYEKDEFKFVGETHYKHRNL